MTVDTAMGLTPYQSQQAQGRSEQNQVAQQQAQVSEATSQPDTQVQQQAQQDAAKATGVGGNLDFTA